MARLETTLANCTAAGSSLLILPKLYLTGYNFFAAKGAEPRGGSSYTDAQALAVKYSVSIAFTYPELDGEDVFDSVALLHRSGKSFIDYRKVNLASGESTVFAAGVEFAPVVEIEPGIRAGLLICFDIFLPEPSRILAPQ